VGARISAFFNGNIDIIVMQLTIQEQYKLLTEWEQKMTKNFHLGLVNKKERVMLPLL
jgi:hypothetical protein